MALAAHCLLAFAVLFGCLFGVAAPAPDQPAPESVGVIDGPAIAIEGPMQVEVVHGAVRTILRSGADVHVKSGQARIDLVEGGAISICGPAHFSVLKSGSALTLALETGTIHAHIDHEPALTIYTTQVQAKPVAIGDGPQDTLMGLDATGAMCIRAVSGAVRIEQQLTGQSMLIPQSGDVQLANGQLASLRNGAGHCACELQLINAAPEFSLIASAAGARPKIPPASHAAREEPLYQVFMPPLAFDASAKVQPEPDMRLIVLVRRVRVRPTLIFRGRVEGDPVTVPTTATTTSSAPPAAPSASAGSGAAPQAASAQPPKNNSDSLFSRVRGFFRRLWTRNP